MTVAILDAGALIGLEHRSARMDLALTRLERAGARLIIPSSVLAQVWRDGSRQARLARLRALDRVSSEPLDDHAALAVGQLLARSGTRDVVDAHVVVAARRAKALAVLTSDPEDLSALDATLRLVAV